MSKFEFCEVMMAACGCSLSAAVAAYDAVQGGHDADKKRAYALRGILAYIERKTEKENG